MDYLTRLGETFFDWGKIAEVLPSMFTVGLPNTLVLAITSGLIGAFLGLILALMGISRNPVARWAARVMVATGHGRSTRRGAPHSDTHDRPVSTASFEDEVDRFEPSGPGTLRDRGDLIDEDGDDIRMYTGEPVETDEGWVVPQQQNFAGRDNIAGGGEWPDPHAEPARPAPGTARRSEDDDEEPVGG